MSAHGSQKETEGGSPSQPLGPVGPILFQSTAMVHQPGLTRAA
jgi:hypothetical protein